MTVLSDISNETIRAEIEEFVERPEEIKRFVELFSQANPVMQTIAATVILGEHHEADRLTVNALNDGFEALEIMDDGLIAGMGIVGIGIVGRFRIRCNCWFLCITFDTSAQLRTSHQNFVTTIVVNAGFYTVRLRESTIRETVRRREI